MNLHEVADAISRITTQYGIVNRRDALYDAWYGSVRDEAHNVIKDTIRVAQITRDELGYLADMLD